jgi:O-antigen/teichoic acid export membrane protein
VALGAVLLRRARPAGDPESADPGPRAVLAMSWPLALNGGLALLSLRVEVLALAAFRGAAEAGLFAAALKVVEFAAVVPAAIGAGALPALTREALRGDGPVRERTASIAALLAVPAAVGLVFVAPGLLHLLYGAAFAEGGAPLRVLALALPPVFMNAVLLHALVAAGRPALLPGLTARRVAAALACALVLVPTLGPVGAAAGFVVAEALLTALASRVCAASRFPVPLGRPLARAAALSAPMAAVVALVPRVPVLAVPLGVATYAATLAAAARLRLGAPRREAA